MRVALVTVDIPPFRENSPWLYGLETFGDLNLDLIAASDREQFGQGEYEGGTVHLLNVFADHSTDWTRRELTEFSVKAYVYLSKLHRREAYDRFVVVDCGGVEPLVVSNLSVMAPVHVVEPRDELEGLGHHGDGLLKLAKRRIDRGERFRKLESDSWPPVESVVREIFDELIE